MGISVSLLLAAAGAVLIWAVNASVSEHSHGRCDPLDRRRCRLRDFVVLLVELGRFRRPGRPGHDSRPRPPRRALDDASILGG
jgi:hypothetical protein